MNDMYVSNLHGSGKSKTGSGFFGVFRFVFVFGERRVVLQISWKYIHISFSNCSPTHHIRMNRKGKKKNGESMPEWNYKLVYQSLMEIARV